MIRIESEAGNGLFVDPKGIMAFTYGKYKDVVDTTKLGVEIDGMFYIVNIQLVSGQVITCKTTENTRWYEWRDKIERAMQ